MRRPRLGAVLGATARVVAALLLIASLFSVWRLPTFESFGDVESGGYFLIFYPTWPPDLGSVLNLGLGDDSFQDGWERWRLLDVALVALALGLVSTTVFRRRALAALMILGALAAGTCISLTGLDSGSPGPYIALAALALAIVALAPLLRRPRAPTL